MHHEPAAAEAVDQEPGKGHHRQVEEVVAHGDVLGGGDAEAEQFEDLGPVDGDSAVAGEGLIDLAHDGDDGGVELVAGGIEHVGVAGHPILLLFLVGGDELVEVLLGAFLAVDPDHTLFRLFPFIVEDEPTWGLGQAGGDAEEHDGIDLHDDDGKTPGPLIRLAQVVGQEDIDQEGHVEAQDVGLKLLGEGGAAGVVVGEFGGVNGNDGVDASCMKSVSYAT